MPILTTRFPTTPYILRSSCAPLLLLPLLPLAFMPARTLSDDSDPALSPPRFYSHPQRHSLSAIAHRDPHDHVHIDHGLYNLTVPSSHVLHPDMDHIQRHYVPSHSPMHADRVYPGSAFPPPWQVPIPQYRDTRVFVPPSAGPLHPHPAAHPRVSNALWQSHLPPVVRVQSFPPPPPPMTHKVWILDCKGCGTFLTNRGMKAVLLLRPNVPLYSTDALPVNCSAFSSSPDSTSAPSTSSSPPITPANPAPFAQPSTLGADRPLTRTCECLTQTLCCHGCGSAVGYMIVSPCHRCTSSITANNRATNGHRFVFYSSEIVAGERYYVAGERGVHPCVLAPASPSMAPRTASPPLSPPAPELALGRVSRGAYPPAEFLPTPPPEDDTEFDALLRLSSPGTADAESRASAASAGAVPPGRPPSHSTLPHNPGASGFVDPATRPQPPRAPAQQEGLKDGEVLYWHHLVRSGEIPGVCEDPRARGGRTPQVGSAVDAKTMPSRRVSADGTRRVAKPVVAGR